MAGDRVGESLSLVALAQASLANDVDPSLPMADGALGTPPLHPLSEEGLRVARETGDPWAVAFALYLRLFMVDDAGTRDLARATIEEAVSAARGAGDHCLLCLALWQKSLAHAVMDEPAAAKAAAAEMLRFARELDDQPLIVQALHASGLAHLAGGTLDEAGVCLAQALHTALATGVRGMLNFIVGGFDYIARGRGQFRRAARLWAASHSFTALKLTSQLIVPEMVRVLGLDEATARMEWDAGRAMSDEEVFACCLEEPKA